MQYNEIFVDINLADSLRRAELSVKAGDIKRGDMRYANISTCERDNWRTALFIFRHKNYKLTKN